VVPHRSPADQLARSAGPPTGYGLTVLSNALQERALESDQIWDAARAPADHRGPP
jgi:hypothetical protein